MYHWYIDVYTHFPYISYAVIRPEPSLSAGASAERCPIPLWGGELFSAPWSGNLLSSAVVWRLKTNKHSLRGTSFLEDVSCFFLPQNDFYMDLHSLQRNREKNLGISQFKNVRQGTHLQNLAGSKYSCSVLGGIRCTDETTLLLEPPEPRAMTCDTNPGVPICFPSHRGTPSHHPNFRDFPLKPTLPCVNMWRGGSRSNFRDHPVLGPSFHLKWWF